MSKKVFSRLFKVIKEPSIVCVVLIDKYFSPLFSDRLYLQLMFWLKLKKQLDLKNPRIFSEKIQWLKLYDRRPEYTIMVDKVKVKEYVTQKLGAEYVIPTLGVWDNPDEINFATLPDKFVLKCNHNSGTGMYVCTDKSKMDVEKVKMELSKGLKENYYLHGREWPYKNVSRKVLAEQYMQDISSEELKDYKFFCFNGHVEYCQVIADRSTCETIDFYDRRWIHQPFIGLHAKVPHPHAKVPHACPLLYRKMIEIAETLAAGIPFVRVDLYYINDRIYFGEITFFPHSGTGVFSPDEWNERLGEMIKI